LVELRIPSACRSIHNPLASKPSAEPQGGIHEKSREFFTCDVLEQTLIGRLNDSFGSLNLDER
jgi:hypothetical protein